MAQFLPPPVPFRQLLDVEMSALSAGCRVFESTFGRIVVHPTFSVLYDANLVVLKRLPSDLNLKTLETRVRPAFKAVGATHLRFVADANLVSPMAGRFLDAGYRRTLYVIMVATNAPVLVRSSSVVVNPVEDYLGEAVLDSVESELMHEMPWNSDLIRAALRIRRREATQCLDLRWFLAELEGVYVGSIGLLRAGMIASIQAVSTRPAHRGRAVATTMVLDLLDRARDLGHTTISLMTEADEWPSHFYSRLGFVAAGYVESFLKDE